MTADTIIRNALVEMNGIPFGESIPDDRMTWCLSKLNRMLKQWSTLRRFIYTIQAATYTLTPPKTVYTIGRGTPAADFVADRPVGSGPGNGIKNANLILTSASPYTRIPLSLLDDDQWAAIPVTNISSSVPVCLYNDGADPNSNLYLWPWAADANQLELFTPQQLTEFADIFTDYSLPTGYEEAVTLSLAVAFCPSFGRPLDPVLDRAAREARANIAGLNSEPPKLMTDYPRQVAHPYFNYKTGLRR